MTNQEALTELKASIEGCGFQCHIETYRSAIGALEKQVPQKPKSYRLPPGIKKATCPRCLMMEDESANYCRSCGQALEWG